jgi:A/G-specific adenine glycosylase
MLQQTRVDTALPYYERFMRRFPTVESLAEGSIDEVLGMWSGLGYYSRARNMHKAAQMVAGEGRFPLDINGLRAMPGVGEYMAAAIASIALGQDEATVDGNIARVMARLHGDASPRKSMWAHARKHLPPGRAGDYNQALMDLGARVCLPKRARCLECPISSHCQALVLDQVSNFPPPKKKRIVPTLALGCVVVPCRDGFWFGRRPPDGLWGGLWELPTKEIPQGQGSAAHDVAEWFGQPVEPVGEIRHVLTHRIVELHVFSVSETVELAPFHYEQMTPYDTDSLSEIGVSALTRKAIHLFQSVASGN